MGRVMVKSLLRRLARWLARPRVWVGLGVAVAALGAVGYFVGPRVWADYHLRAATRELDRHHPGAARAHLDRVLRVRPESADVHRLAGGPKRLTWYEDDHNFTSIEAMRDRLYWLQAHLHLRGVEAALRRWMAVPPRAWQSNSGLRQRAGQRHRPGPVRSLLAG